MVASLEPDSHTCDEEEVVHALPFVAREIRCFSELPLPLHADIGCELADKFVSQPKPDLDIVDAAADAELTDLLNREIDLGSGLQNEALRDQEVVLGLQARGNIAFIGNERRAVNLKEIGHQTLQSQDQMPAFRIRPEVVAEAGLDVEPRRDGAAPTRLHLGFLELLAKTALALGLDPQLVDVAAIPALRIPEIAVPAIMDTCFELVDHHPIRPHFALRSEEHTSELQSLMRISYAVFCLKKKHNK